MRGFEPLAWLFQAISGIAMVFLITAHFLITHSSHDLLSYESVVFRMSNAEYKIFYALLLIFVTFHAFQRAPGYNLRHRKGMKRRKAVSATVFPPQF